MTDATLPSWFSAALLAEVEAEVARAVQRAAIDTPRRDGPTAARDALYIFREIYDISGDSALALEAAVGWPGVHPDIYRQGAADYVESFVLYALPHIWDGKPKASAPPR